MRLLLINANTTPAITELMVNRARGLVSAGTTVTGVTARLGARYIATRPAYSIAGHAALDAYAEHGASSDAIILACFGDPGLMALRELSAVPVVGMAEASCQAAAGDGRRFAIVTGGAGWVPMLREFVAAIGLADRLVSVRAVAPSGAEIATDPQRSYQILARECTAAAKDDGAEVVILGGAGLVGIADAIARDVPVPLIDCLTAAIRAAEAAAGDGGHASQRVHRHIPPVESIGLGAGLSALLLGKRPAG
jgi:Asp/Glu/hydantoin racemase